MKTDINLRYVWMISLTAALGGFLFGYDWVVIGGAKPFYETFFNINDPGMSGWLVSSALLGCIIGAILSGFLSERFGRKKTLLVAALLFLISAAGTAFANSILSFTLFRVLGGVGIGISAALSPVYIAEISPPDKRGKMVAINQLMIVIGVLMAQLINLNIAQPVPEGLSAAESLGSWNVQSGWRYMFGAELVPAFGFFILMFYVPESPRWLIKKSEFNNARIVLSKIGSTEYVERTFSDINGTLKIRDGKIRLSDLRSAKARHVLMIGCILAFYQQWTGINIIFNYAQEVFASVGFDINDTLKSIVATGAVNLAFTVIAIPLVDKIGRRKLMLLGAGGLTIIHGLIACCFAFGVTGFPVLFLILGAIAVYAMTLAPVTWVLLSEIFSNKIREFAVAICTSVLWMASFLLTLSFPFIIANFGAVGSFGLYGLISGVALWFIYSHVPETMGRSLEQLEHELFTQNKSVIKS